MYEFRNLKAEYIIEAKNTCPDGQISRHSSRIALNAEYQHAENSFLFVLKSKTGIKLNAEEPQKPIDTYIDELGACLYPINLCVSPEGEIISLLNFSEIRERWKQTSAKLLHDNYSAPLERYIDTVRKNLQTEKNFLEALQRDIFIQLYFQPQATAAESSDFTCYYFPEQDIQSITGSIRQGESPENEYIKEIVIQSDSTKREVKKANKTISMITSLLA